MEEEHPPIVPQPLGGRDQVLVRGLARLRPKANPFCNPGSTLALPGEL